MANPDVLPLTALLSALAASRERCDDCIPSHPRADSIITSSSMSERASPPLAQKSSSQHSIRRHPSEKKPHDGSFLENLHTETNSVDRKTTSRLLPLTSFGVKSPQKKQTLPPHLSHRLMMKHPPDRQLPADTSLTCGYLITSPVRGTSNSKRILRNTCWTFGAAPENIIGFLVCSWKDRLTDTAE